MRKNLRIEVPERFSLGPKGSIPRTQIQSGQSGEGMKRLIIPLADRVAHHKAATMINSNLRVSRKKSQSQFCELIGPNRLINRPEECRMHLSRQ
jgi:hypothetical protein